MVSYIRELDEEFCNKMELIGRGESEMTHEYAYDFVFYLSEMFFGLTYEAEDKRKDYWLSVSKPEWMSIIVHNFINFDYSLRDVKENRRQQIELEDTWKNQASEVLSNLLDHHGPDTLPLLTPLLEEKNHRGHFFSLVWDCSHQFDVIDLIAHFAEPEAQLEGWELDQYISLLGLQDAERAIPLLETVRRNYADAKLPESGFPAQLKSVVELTDYYIESLKIEDIWEKPKWGWEAEEG